MGPHGPAFHGAMPRPFVAATDFDAAVAQEINGVVDGSARCGDDAAPQPKGFLCSVADPGTKSNKKRAMHHPVYEGVKTHAEVGCKVFQARDLAVAGVEDVASDKKTSTRQGGNEAAILK